uniref:Rho-GAP domain-containing protein n=1 Tax=Steinernema glaseri TaxID=37863 RepID=A0A1I8A182_9BILA
MLFPEMNRAATLDSISHRRSPRSALRSFSVQRSPIPNHRSASIFTLNECKHFHFFLVELGPVKVDFSGFKHISDGSSAQTSFYDWVICLDVESNKKQWTIHRTMREMIEFDYQLHRCVFDRAHSRLREIEELVESQRDVLNHTELYVELSNYTVRLSRLTGSIITCFPVLKFLELDSRGNHFIPAEYTPINTPAIAAAIVIRNYTAKTPDQLTIRIGDIVSVIEMSSPEQSSDNFWKAKLTISFTSPDSNCNDDIHQQFEVGYLPSDCVKLFVGKCMIDDDTRRGTERWERLKRSGLQAQKSIKKFLRTAHSSPKVFGVDLQRHLSESKRQVPVILTRCVETIEKHGVVTGIYRQCGIQSNIRKLRNEFDTGGVPNFSDPEILQDIHCVSSLLKQYFRQLPNPLFTFELYSDLVSCYEKESAQKVQRCRDIIRRLPAGHLTTAEYLMTHLSKMCSFTNLTDMTSRNLAIVWAPNLIRSPPTLLSNDSLLLHGLNVQTSLCNFLIANAKAIFSDDLSEISTPSTSEERTCLEVGAVTSSAPVARSQTAPDLSNRSCVEINGGPSQLPPTFHTVLERPNRKISDHFMSWRRLIRGPSVDRSILGFVGRKKDTIPDPYKGFESENAIKWRRSHSTDVFRGIRNSDSVISFVTRPAEYLRERGWRSWFTRKSSKKSDSPDELSDSEPQLLRKTAIEMTPPIESFQLSSGFRSLQQTSSSLSPVINNAENVSILTSKQSSDSDERSPRRKERRVVFRSEMDHSFEAVNQIIDHLESEEKSDSEWATTEDEEQEEQEEEEEEERGSSPSLCLDMSRYDNVSPNEERAFRR